MRARPCPRKLPRFSLVIRILNGPAVMPVLSRSDDRMRRGWSSAVTQRGMISERIGIRSKRSMVTPPFGSDSRFVLLKRCSATLRCLVFLSALLDPDWRGKEAELLTQPILEI